MNGQVMSIMIALQKYIETIVINLNIFVNKKLALEVKENK